jgi:hypothetical protein
MAREDQGRGETIYTTADARPGTEGQTGVINPKKHRITKEHWAKLVAGQKRSQDRRRGFSVPKHLWDEYSFLVNSKKLTAIQAGIMLGIIGKPVKKAA